MANSERTNNAVPVLQVKSSAGDGADVILWADPVTHRLLVDVSGGGGGSAGTEYTEGDTDTTITGTAIMWEDASDTLRSVSMAKPLPVQPGTAAAFPVTDNGGSLTVDGSVTVTQGTGSNLHAVVDSGTITTITNVVHVDDNSSSLSIDDGGSLISVDDGGGSITVDGTVTETNSASALTSLQLIDDVVFAEDAASANGDKGIQVLAVRKGTPANTSGTDGDYEPLQVSGGRLWASVVVDTALPAGNNTIGNIGTVATITNVVHVDDNASTISIDDGGGSITVDGTVTASIAAGATTIAKAEDAASADADVGVPAMAVRKGTPANTSGTDGDYEMLQMSAGRLWASATIDAALPAGTNSIGKISDITTSVVPGTGATNLGKAEDAAHSSGDTGVMALAVRETTVTDLSAGNTDGDYEPVQVNKSGALWATLAPSSTSGLSAATGSIGATKTDIGSANTAGQVFGWYFYNSNSSVVYVQFFNGQASAVTLGTTAPVYSIGIPATSGANVFSDIGINHSTAISIAITTTRAGSTGPSSTVDYNIFYKQ